MTVTMKITGFRDAQKTLKKNAEILEGTRGQFYSHQTKILKKVIDRSADPSYEKSPAKAMALKSTETWVHSGRQHTCNIMSTRYANYRQYGCGGIRIVKLVNITKSDQLEMVEQAKKDLNV